MDGVFGLDFGTTNCVASLIQHDPQRRQLRPIALTNLDDGRPHPSVVWYSADGPIVGRKARDQMSELGLGVFGDVVRSPKMFLGSGSPVCVGGTSRSAADIVGAILSFLREDALRRDFPGHNFDRAVVTVPIKMQGRARRELREAAHKAGLHIHQFVHEPLAALYGYVRTSPRPAEELSRLEGRLALVFDWGGGTLDLTLCRFMKGALVQVLNVGDMEVGGDKFDLRIRSLVRERHQQEHPAADWNRLQPTAEARLLKACEDAKIALSEREKTTVYVREVLAVKGPARDLEVEISRTDLRQSVEDLVRRGLSTIQRLMDAVGVPVGALDFCLATGGMVAMPTIREGLIEILGASRLRTVPNSATIISEGAAWIAYDGLRLTLAKPLECLLAGESYMPMMTSQTILPVEGDQIEQSMSLYCVDPRDGKAKFQFARPKWPGHESPADDRLPYLHLALPVDPFAKPLFERLEVSVTVDQDLVAKVRAGSTLSKHSQTGEIHDLEFALALAKASTEGTPADESTKGTQSAKLPNSTSSTPEAGSIRIRSNLANTPYAWKLVPGEIVQEANQNIGRDKLTDRQKSEKMYYVLCLECGRTIYEIERDGCESCAASGHALSPEQARRRWSRTRSVFKRLGE